MISAFLFFCFFCRTGAGACFKTLIFFFSVVTVLKKSSSGMELELQLLDRKGRIANRANEVIEAVKKESGEIDIVTESFQNMVELRSLPRVRLKDSFPRLFDDLISILEVSKKLDLEIFGIGCYPGSFQSEPTKKKRYKVQKQIVGETYDYYNSHCAGFHYHYTLPWGVFDHKQKFLKKLYNSKTKDSLLDSYNLLIAVDPAVSTMMQSSPFVERKFVAKDSRMLLYRDHSDFGESTGLFEKIPEFGELPNYVWTMEDLRQRLLSLDERYRGLWEKTKYKKSVNSKKILDFVWTVVKINKIGTLEYRGCDMNHPKYFAATAVLLKSIQRVVQQNFYRVEVSDIAIKEPFKVEGEKIFIPPQSYVKMRLQPLSARKGFESDEVYNYTKRFYNFAKKHSNPDYHKFLNPLKHLVDRRKTVSDILIDRVKAKGYSLDNLIPQEVCAELALEHAAQFRRESYKIKDRLPE